MTKRVRKPEVDLERHANMLRGVVVHLKVIAHQSRADIGGPIRALEGLIAEIDALEPKSL